MTSGPLRRLLGLARRAADPTDDAGLLARFAATADADAFELLVWRHGGMVLGVARRILGDVHAAEDAFQATFLALARQAKSVRRDGCVAGWLHRVARRVAMRARRQRGASLRFEPSANAPDDPIAAASHSDLCRVLDDELDRLPERFRRAVVLCYLEGHSTAEAAERLGCPRGTVLSRLATAREKLRARLIRRGVTPAIWPPIVLPPVTQGGLIARTVRAVVANTASPPVIELCDGVIRAMILSKLKFASAALLTVGMIGGGAGWMTLTPGGPGNALAGPQAKAETPSRTDTSLEQQRRIEQDKLSSELSKADQDLAGGEHEWAKERAEARLELMLAEARVKVLKRLNSPENQATELEEARKNATESIRHIGATMAEERAKPDHAQTKAYLDDLEKQFEAERKKLNQAMMQFEKRSSDMNRQFLPNLREMMLAEERLSLLDRDIALKRRVRQARVEDLQDRYIQFLGGTGRPDPVDRKVKDLERKLDDVLRELTELRRELRK